MDKTTQFFKALGDETRICILNVLADGPKHVELIAEAVSLTNGTVSFHLKKLEAVGLVSSQRDQYYRNYHLRHDLFKKSLAHFIGLKPADEQLSAQENYRDRVVQSFLRHGKLKSIPVQRKKRLIILKELAKNFKKNREYPEKEVNRILSEYHEDFCTLRRELVSSKIMSRSKGIYRVP